MRYKKILVTGGAGFIGSCLLPELLKKKYSVRVLDNLFYGYHGLLPHVGNSSFDFIYGDIRKIDDLKKSLDDVDVVIHLAALVGYPACKARPRLAHEINYLGTKKLISLCKVPIIFTSTGSCYGQVNGICTEESPLDPITEYGQTKMKAEQEIRTHTDFIIYRFSTGFGMSLRPRLDLLINDFVLKAVKNKELIIFEKDYWRAFIHVKDMVRSLLFALDHFDTMNHETYNVGSETLCFTKGDLAERIQKYVDFYVKYADFGHDPDKRNYKISFKKIYELGFTPRYSVDYGIKEMIQACSFMDVKECYYNNQVFK